MDIGDRKIRVIPGTIDIDELLTMTANHAIDYAIKQGILEASQKPLTPPRMEA